ncbi:TPR-like protein [Rhizoctonia solani]|uniref:TPR-like protein n=1 Tax=Rhizoctonia solani TaxID=456999 RepID=A0A8H7I8A6_9AGAM|nr:TPR-like protein [Rhizoctonia solani]
MTPDEHPNMPLRISCLGIYYDERYRRLGNLEDMNKSIECDIRALGLTPDNDPELPARLANMGASYGMCYTRMGRVEDLEKSIEYKSRALAFTPDAHPDLPVRHAALGVSYTHRYRRMEKPQTSRSPSNATLVHSPSLPMLILTYHAGMLILEYHTLIDIDAWEKPQTSRGSSNATLAHSPSPPTPTLTCHAADLEKSIEYKSHALTLTPNGHPDLPYRHAALGVSYTHRYRRMEKPQISKNRYAALGASYTSRYRRMGEAADLEKSIEYKSRALALLPMTIRTYPPGISTGLHHVTTNISLMLSTASPRDVFLNAFRWAKLASQYTYLTQPKLSTQSSVFSPSSGSATTAQRYHDLSLADNVAVRAASAAIRSSEHSLALEWLDHARCIVWSQTLMLRSPLDALTLSDPLLASRLQEYNDLLAQARKLPGLEHFLQPAKANSLTQAARYGPVIVVNCYQADCDALVILPGQDHIRHLTLPNFTELKAQRARSEIERMLRIKGLRERGFHLMHPPPDPDVGAVLTSLWKDLVRPVLDHLGYLVQRAIGEIPHVTWCPTGVLSFLPLHAAGDYDQPRSRVFDYIISSYTPTLTALLSPTPTVANRPLGYSPLAKQPHRVVAHCKAQSWSSNSQATTAAVLDAMEQYDWVHLACHAHQNIVDPTRSGFFLHDGTLDLAAITQRSFRNKGLAFLSACQTATGDTKLPDEAIHLASGMLMAGYPSVIASMWSVVDEDAPFVADKVYAHLMKDGKVGNGEAGKALHEAAAELRKKVGEKEFGRESVIRGLRRCTSRDLGAEGQDWSGPTALVRRARPSDAPLFS